MLPFRTPARMFLVLAGLAYAAESRAGDTRIAIPSDLVLQRFVIARGGDTMLIPVTIGGKDRLFAVDTGCTTTVVDWSLLADKPRQFVKTTTADAVTLLGLYEPPDATLGGLRLGIDSVIGMDLKRWSEVSGYPIEGILGMDFLGQHVLHIDFDRGDLMLLKSAPKDFEQTAHIVWKPGEIPSVDVSVTREEKVWFNIDTGQIGPASGSIRSSKIRSLDEYREVGAQLHESLSGTYRDRLFRGKELSLGGFGVKRPVFSETTGSSRLGLGFWSRFVVTLDFPGRNLYLSRGQGYERADRCKSTSTGLALVLRDGAVVVESVDEKSPGAKAGLRAGDVLLALNGLRTQETTLFRLRSALWGDGRCLCLVRRGNQEQQLTLILPTSE